MIIRKEENLKIVAFEDDRVAIRAVAQTLDRARAFSCRRLRFFLGFRSAANTFREFCSSAACGRRRRRPRREPKACGLSLTVVGGSWVIQISARPVLG